MENPSPEVRCPECGAPLKNGDKQCWMCFRLLYWEGGTVKISAASRFSDPPQSQPRVYYRTNPWAVIGVVLVALLMVPACMVACLVTCFTAAEINPQGVAMPLLSSLAAGLAVLLGFVTLIGMLGKRVTRPFQH